MKLTPQEAADQLIGTANFGHQITEEFTPEEFEQFDALAFECDGCGWWCSTEELNNGTDRNLCDECKEDGEE